MLKEPPFRIKEFIRLSHICKEIVQLGEDSKSTTLRAYEAERLFNKITLHSISLLSFGQKKMMRKALITSTLEHWRVWRGI